MEKNNEITKAPTSEIAIPSETAPPDFGANRGPDNYPQDIPDEPESGGLIEYWRILQRRKGTLILITGIGLVAAILATLPQTPIYQARTTLEVLEMNQNFMNMQDVQQVNEAAGFNLMADLQTQIKILQSDSLKTRTIATLKGNKSGSDNQPSGRISAWRRALNLPDSKTADPHGEALTMAARTAKARASGQTKIIEVQVDSTDPKVAADYANQLLQEYIDQNMESRWKITQRTSEFLSKQLDEMKIKLERSEDALQNYARQNGLVFTGGDEKSGRTNVSEDRLRQLQAALTVAQTERVQRQSRWEQASTATPDTLSDVLNDRNLQDYQTRLTDLRRQKAELEETYTAENPKVRRVDAQIRTVEKSLDRQRADILKKIKNEYDEAARRERLLDGDYRKQTGIVTEQGGKAIQYNILKRESETNRQLYEAMLQRLKEASLASALRAANVRVVDTARVPTAPYKPSLVMNSAVGLLGGFFCAVGFIVMTDRANRTLQDPTDIAFYLQTLELGMIPSDSSTSRKKRKLLWKATSAKGLSDGQLSTDKSERVELVTFERKPGLMAESFRAALTSILFTGQNGNRPRVLAVTSPSPAEGKTTVVTNLAIAMAETGHKVLLIDADMRKPRIHDIFDVSNETGLTTLLRGEAPFTQDTTTIPVHGTQVPGLFVLPAGPTVAGSTNLLYSKRLSNVLAKLQNEFSMILIDTPPMLQIPDARVIGRVTQGIVLVVRANVTTRDAAVAARARLRDDGVRVIGTVMNDWNPKRSPGGYYGYYDGYHRYYRRYGGYYGSSQ